MMLKVAIALIAAVLLGMLMETWLMLVPPTHTPPHPSYLPAE
jgi:hypothetical protein